MPLKKLQLRPGVNRENTRYFNEGTWYETDKVRFRQGSPEKIGGWDRISNNSYQGVCRSLWNWITLSGSNLVGVGTHLKFYIERGGAYNDITPIRETQALTDPFDTTDTSDVVEVTDAAHGAANGDFVTFSGATAVGGLTIDGEYQITYVDANTYTITAASAATSTATGGGSVTAAYQVNVGLDIDTPSAGWGGGTWGLGAYGVGGTSENELRIWSQSNFGEDLVFNARGDGIFYWDATNGVTTRGIYVEDMVGASGVPTVSNVALVSDINRFVFSFGCNDIGSATLDPMLIRWCDQEDITNWTPAATNQAGSLRVSHGTEIVTAIQARQEVLVLTDSAVYGLQYLGAPEVWGAQLLGDNTSIASQNAVAYASGGAYWMGRDKFYAYDGTVRPLPCDVRKYVFNDFNTEQYGQVHAGTNEGYHEVWWFYCSSGSTTVDRYVVFNYLDNVWYYGTLARTAWLDSGLRDSPLAATYQYNLVNHEVGYDCRMTTTTYPITATITSAEFDIDDGHKFALISRILPDVTFSGSTTDAPAMDITLQPMQNSGSGYNSPMSVSGENSTTVARSATVPIEEFTGMAHVRVRGRQMSIKLESTGEGVAWQIGSIRLDMRPDGRR